MKINLSKIKLSAQNIALVSLATITFTSWLGLGLSMKSKAEGEGLTPVQWVLLVQGSIAYAGFLGILNDDIEEDKKPDDFTGELGDERRARVEDLQAQTHIVLGAEFDENLANAAKDIKEIVQRVYVFDERIARRARVSTATVEEKEQQARCRLITKLSDFGTGANPLEALYAAIQICSDIRIWIEPARPETVYQDIERFYGEGKIWPIVRNNGIIWSLDPDYNPPEETLEIEETVEQTPFRAFRCCSRCKFIDDYRSSCAVVPFGCGTGDRSDDCREFEAKDDGNQGVEIDRPESEIVRVAMETLNSSSLWQE